MGMPIFVQTNVETMTSIGSVLLLWLKSSLKIALLIASIVFVKFLIQTTDTYRLIPKLSKLVEPILRLFGLLVSTAFLWIIAYIVGLSYGGALMIDQMQEGKVTRREASLLNYHLALSHSVLKITFYS